MTQRGGLKKMENMKSIIATFDDFLKERGLAFRAIVIGGAALNIMDVTTRFTKDVDLIDPEIPAEIKQASVEFVKVHPEFNLQENWFNNGPISLIRDLEDGWRENIVSIYKGVALELLTLGRIDLLKSKLYALCDRGVDFNDCVNLAPTDQEIGECMPWLLQGDGNPLWPDRVKEMIEALKEELKKDE
jgi:hypothetical protein